MKKLISILLSALILSSLTLPAASALPSSDGYRVLNECMLDGECPEALDYVHFAPKTQGDTKYPLVVWLHGRKSGEYKRAQLEWYEFSLWASDDFQARSADNGMFLLLPRSSKNSTHNWSSSDCKDLMTTIKYYISLYPDKIDTSRIYISGYSTGGSMVYYMLSEYPDYFAAAMPICSIHSPSLIELDALKNTSIWLFACDQDPYTSANTISVDGTFDYLKKITNNPQGVRYTTFTEAVWPDGRKQELIDAEHYIWGAVTNDMVMYTGEQYAFSSTIDASGKTISFASPNGVISWLTSQTLKEQEQEEPPTLIERLTAFFKKIIEFLQMIFS